ncbi:MAG: outer membrane protein assembly factor BamA, partial [Muribaculaceae bacterium]|nr:outer membrane protein assembly factor BamA [Muribaculaceae bacterium]
MRYKFLLIIALMAALCSSAQAQTATPADTVYSPTVVFNGTPRNYELAGISVEGGDNYEDFIIIGYTGLRVGQRIDVPGNDINQAVRRLMRQTLFANARIEVEKVANGKVWLKIVVRTQPRVSEVKYSGMKKGEREDIQRMLQLMPGTSINQNIVNRATSIIKKYFADKGFNNAVVRITLQEDLSKQNEVIVNIDVDKHDKVKVHKIYIDGNEVLSDGALQRVMKKTNESGKLLNLFKQKKFVESDYRNDLDLIIQKYNEKGYRDATIIADSVVPYSDNKVDVYITLDEGKKYYISDIDWVGNTVYPTDQLEAILGIKPGEVYNQKLLSKRLNEDEDAIANYYMDNGYLFYNIVPIEKNVHGDSVALEMRMMEGPQARINKVVINGNDRLYEKVIRRELRVRPGELFSKSDLMRSYREIAQMGHFNPETIGIDPQPDAENGTVDILFNLESKANDQIEFSMGWGQTGIIGKLALKFTNFSIKNLFNPGSYKGLLPQGEGQTFTISAQTNARYYQAYSISFLDPWFGGKRPNSLQVSAYYSRQTGINSSYYSSNYYNPYMYGGYGYGYGYGYNSGYYNDYYQNSIENAYDPNKLLQLAGITVGLGKRLSWPDDYFSFTAELSYNWYYLKNWDYLYYMNNGTS